MNLPQKILFRWCPKISGVLLALSVAIISPATAQPGDPIEGEGHYGRACVPCHGSNGEGDGFLASRLKVRPRDHTDDAAMSAFTDQELFQIIKEGGASMNKSSQMPSFGTIANPIGIMLTDEEIWDVVSYIRTLHRPSKSSEE